MNTLNRATHGHLRSVLSGFKSRVNRKTRRLTGTTRPLELRPRPAALSSASLLMWRLLAHGTRPGSAHGLLTAWSGWEHISGYFWPTAGIPAAPNKLFELRLAAYSGPAVVLSDGSKIDHGAMIVEMHCSNRQILRLMTDHDANPFAAAREDLRSLAAWVKEHEAGRQIRALYGFTMLTRGAARLGFTVRPLPVNIRRRFEKLFMTGLLLLYTTDGVQRLTNGTTPSRYPQEVWMSRRELIRRYGDRPFAARRATPPMLTPDGSAKTRGCD